MPDRCSYPLNSRKQTPNNVACTLLSLSCTARDVVLVCVCLSYIHARDGEITPMARLFLSHFPPENNPLALMRETFASDILWRGFILSCVLHPSVVLVVSRAFTLRLGGAEGMLAFFGRLGRRRPAAILLR